ncbi:MAG TPA: hypothetical protein VD838_09585, partial [Anaeromyxobacteraceae bacterium]|nr:hypothetical protein [Anaeromyxobacteraceae bacterium]
MLKNTRLATQVGFLSVLALLALGVVSLAALRMERSASEAAVRMSGDELRLVVGLNLLHALGLQSGQATRNVLLNPGDAAAKANHRAAHADFVETTAALVRIAPPEMKAALEDVERRWTDQHGVQLEVQRLAEAGRRDEAVSLLVSRETPRWRDLKARIAELQAAQTRAFDAQRVSTIESLRAQRRLVVMIMLLSVAVVAAMWWLIARRVRATVGALVSESKRLTSAVTEGALRTRAEAGGVAPEFRPVLRSFNATMDAYAEPIAVMSDSLTRISRGEVPPPVEGDRRGDFAVVKESVNTCRATLSTLLEDTERLTAAAVEGRFSDRADASRHQGA